MRFALVLALLVPAMASAEPAKTQAPARPQATQCKKKVVGKGLERHVVCEIEVPITVSASNKPAVAIVHVDPRGLVGRPKSNDRLDGLSHQLRP
jgi:hypothetical protein|nr:hypothetical protein [Kofleriaceae bacterium]